jgi:Zn-dependent peptidase ImmA (M78 family)
MDKPINNSGFGASNASETCDRCGQPLNHGLEQFLGRLGISDDMINNLKSSMENVDVEEYLNTARDYLKTNSDKAKSFAKDNPGKVAAGVAVLAVGAGLLISALNRD